MEKKLQQYIIKGLLDYNEFLSLFADKLDKKYFDGYASKLIHWIVTLYDKRAKRPSKSEIYTLIEKYCKDDIEKQDEMDEYFRACVNERPEDKEDTIVFLEWIVEETKDFIQYRAVEDALSEAILLMEANKPKQAVEHVYKSTQINFDEDLGLNYIQDMEKRLKRLAEKDLVIPTGLTDLDIFLNGGLPKKSLTIFGAATNVGKTLVLSAITHNLVKNGFNGVYITLEINEFLLANRFDANFSDIDLSHLDTNIESLKTLLQDMKNNQDQYGELWIKEYLSEVNTNMIYSYIKQLEQKKDFRPDFICVDYLGLLKPNSKGFSDNSYGKLKTATEELRTIAGRLDIPVLSAVQVNRDGYQDEVIDLDKMADSMGIAHGADIIFMLSRTPDMDEKNLIYFHNAKNRYAKNGGGFYVKVDYSHMRLLSHQEGPVIKKKPLETPDKSTEDFNELWKKD